VPAAISVHNARNTVRPTRAPRAESLLPYRAQTTLGLLRQQVTLQYYASQPALAVTSIYHSCPQESTSEIILKVRLHFRTQGDKLCLVFTARCYASEVLAMALCPSVRPSVCPSQIGLLLKRLNIGSHKQHHTIAKGL